MICQSKTPQKKEKTGLDYGPLPCEVPHIVSSRNEPETSQSHMQHLTTRGLAISEKWVLRDGIDILVQYFSVLRHAAAWFNTPTNRPPK
mmetsp:Transcript_58045/g.95334  ORF Transcript_58045/g.95334 Transcript_58045/m.95334 type:complete len:89 (+) Transcript_58045:603-869(+)